MRVFTAFIAITAGILVFGGYFLQDIIPVVLPLQTLLLNWAVILVGAATLVGVLNLMIVHLDKVSRRERGSGYSILLAGALVVSLLLGILLRPEHELMQVMMNGIIVPAESALMGLLTITLVYAAIRLLRRRADVMSIIFLITAAVIILGTATLPFGNIPVVDVFSSWVTQVLAVGGARGILIGVSLGALTTGLRVLFGIDRPYGGN